MRKIFFCSLLLIVFLGSAESQVYTQKDVDVCNTKFQLAVKEDLSSKPINDVIVDVGKSFIGTDYEAHTLEKKGNEQLVIHLTGLDCTTFLENVLTFARCIKEHKTSFEDYENELTKIRYRNGKIDSYPSRLHYFSDWIFNNQKKGIVKDITQKLGGIPIKFNLNFMSTHPDSYLKLKENPDFIPVIEKQEEKISKRTYYYIPKEKVDSIDNKIESGDLIAITTKIKGLDIGHVGIAIRMEDGKIHLLHAPIPGTKVQISDLPLGEYLSKLKNDSGIIVLKAVDPAEKYLTLNNTENFNNQKNDPKKDKEQIIELENTWLNNLHDKAALDSILAPDFIHILPEGIFITKQQHIDWEVNHPLQIGYKQRFDTLNVRIYGETGIVNGIVETFDQKGKSIQKTIFTDIFIKRNGRWQAVNAQENRIQ